MKGLEGLHRQLIQTLQRHGLREVSTAGQFDPFEHEAVKREETNDVDDGTILDVYQKGYALGPMVIRASKVKVSKKAEEEEVHDTQESQSDDRGE
jgi:molecular chaperone GrpE